MSRGLLVLLVLLAASAPAPAQQSSSFILTETTLNAGGHPAGGVVLASGGFRVTLDGIGEALPAATSHSTTFLLAGGFVGALPPPVEVSGLGFSGRQTLVWTAEPTASVYNVYRDDLATLGAGVYGRCWQSGLTQSWVWDIQTPPRNAVFFYLVTAENRLAEEGTKGYDSLGVERPNPLPCP